MNDEEEDSIQSSANLMLEYEHNKKFISEASYQNIY